MKKALITLALSGLFCAINAHAATLEYTASTPQTATNWTDTLSFAKFDSTLGTLNSITFELGGLVAGTGKAESMDSTPSTVSLTLASTITLARPDGSTLVIANPIFNQDFSLSSFDGSIDFSGSSGASTGAISVSDSKSYSSHSASDFALFSAPGGGTINLNLDAAGTSYASGSGNLLSQFNTVAGADIKVSYDYTAMAPVPEPTSAMLLLAGLGVLGLARRRNPPAKFDA